MIILPVNHNEIPIIIVYNSFEITIFAFVVESMNHISCI